jgi:chromosome segregation ATPase
LPQSPRPAALTEADWFELADQLATHDEKPTTPGLAKLAQERHGVTASYSTIQKALVAWRRLGGAERPRELSPQFMQMLVTGFTPIYQQLVAEAGQAFEPRLAAAEEQVTAAAARVDVLRAELEALSAERDHLRATLETTRKREAQLGAEAARAAGQAAELTKQLQQTVEHARAQALESEHVQARAAAERRQEREALLAEQRRALESAQAAHTTAIETLGARHAGELRAAGEERTTLQAHLRETSQAKAQLEARLQSQQGALQEWQARTAQSESRADALMVDLQASGVRLERAEQALREANALSSDRAANYEAQIGELNGRLDAMKIGQRAIEQQFNTLFEKLQRRMIKTTE